MMRARLAPCPFYGRAILLLGALSLGCAEPVAPAESDESATHAEATEAVERAEPAEPAGPRQAVVILLDALRADHMGCYGYAKDTTPNMDALAAEGAVFLQHYTQGTDTRTSLPSMIYSRYFVGPVFPHSNEIPLEYPEDLLLDIDTECTSLPRLFAGDGYYTAGISAHSWITPDTRFAQEFDEFHDRSGLAPPDRGFLKAEDVVNSTIEWIGTRRDDDFLLYVHIMDTHFPHFFEADARELLGKEPPETDRFDRRGFVSDLSTPLSPDEMEYLNALYDGSLRHTDRELGRLFDYLDEIGLLDHGLVAITSDHGEHLLDNPGLLTHGDTYYEELARIPLIVMGRERIPAARVDYLTGMVDLVPTVAGGMGIATPKGKSTDGLNLVPYLTGDTPNRTVMGYERAIRVGNYKAILKPTTEQLLGDNPLPADRVSGYLFDLEKDPKEENNLRESRPDLWNELVAKHRAQYQPLYRRYKTSFTAKTPTYPFAIGVRSFQLSREIPEAKADAARSAAAAELVDGWMRSMDHRWYYLMSRGKSEPLSIEFPLPNGEYEVIFQMSGNCRVRISDEGDELMLSGPTFDSEAAAQVEAIALGIVRVENRVFTASIETDGSDAPFYLKSVGFSPPGVADEGLDGAEAERLERLKALGYVED